MGGFIDVPLVVWRHYIGVVGHKNATNSPQPHCKFVGNFE